MTKLRIEQLRCQRNGPLCLSVAGGETVCLGGESGSGKSLFLRALADLIESSGQVFCDERERSATPAPEWRRILGLLPAVPAWWADTVGPHFSADAPPDFTALGFPKEVVEWEISRLSTGERQRLALLRLLANQPEVLLLDEPTAALDAVNTAKVEKLIAEYRERHQAPVLWVTHQVEQVKRVADRWFVLENGSLKPKTA